jgi:integrase/recombinase XerD
MYAILCYLDINDLLLLRTYNLYLILLIRFFKWLYNPILEPKERPKPQVIQNIPKLKRKEVSIYKPSDLWTLEDDLLFLKWCPSKRDRCYHAISRDLSARPHEILDIKVKDIIFKTVGNKQYAEVLVNGKTGTRHLPLIDSLPYVKEWLDQHPQRNNPNAYFICSMKRGKIGGRLTRFGILHTYTNQYRNSYFPRLLNDPTVPKDDRNKINELLKKPWNLYIRSEAHNCRSSWFGKAVRNNLPSIAISIFSIYKCLCVFRHIRSTGAIRGRYYHDLRVTRINRNSEKVIMP